MSEWKPGDVAMVKCSDGEWRRALHHLYLGHWTWAFGDNTFRDAATSEARPLVVIDPEDAEQVERLTAYLSDTCGYAWPHKASDIQFALREFARPTPRIEEPRGHYAVIEDDAGLEWVRADIVSVINEWKCLTLDRWANFVDLHPVRVLSPGVEVDS